jgi:hypothetical protein
VRRDVRGTKRLRDSGGCSKEWIRAPPAACAPSQQRQHMHPRERERCQEKSKASHPHIKRWGAHALHNFCSRRNTSKAGHAVKRVPPPTTATSCPLNSGDAPSQIAQAEIPRLQNSFSEGMPRRLAVAPVAMMMALVFTVRSAVLTVKGRLEVSMLMTSSVSSSAPHLAACASAPVCHSC